MSEKRNISMENYEIYLIDYLDGNLDEVQTRELMRFLEAHPEIQEEMDALNEVSMKPDVQVSQSFDNLKKPAPEQNINADNLDWYLARLMENDLTEEEQVDVWAFLEQNPDYKREADLFKQLHIPEEKGTFKQKDTLYHLAHEKNESISSDNFDDYAVAFYEEQLQEPIRQQLFDFLSENPEYQAEFELLGKVKLEADLSVQYEDKEALKQQARIVLFNQRTLNYVASLAAVLLFFVLFPGLFDFNAQEPIVVHQKQQSPVAEIPKPEEKVEPKESDPVSIVPKASQRQKGAPKTSTKSSTKSPSVPVANVAKQNRTSETFVLKKAESLKPEISFAHVDINKSIKPNYCLASDSPINGYYEVRAEKDNFLNQNPGLKKRLISGVRTAFNIDSDKLNTREDKLSVWEIADVGIKGINTLTENDFSISRK